MEAFEDAEDLFLVDWIEPNAIVLDGKDPLLTSVRGSIAGGDMDVWRLPAILDGVFNQILKKLLQVDLADPDLG
jgi:hypothetical protein